MSPAAADLEEALQKKGGLTLTQLANYDDLITDALVDRVYFWATIRKLRPTYHACRGVQEENVCKILQDEAIVNKDPAAAQEQLLRLPGLARYHKNLKTTDEKEHFVRHLRKYINMYLPDCPFEVGTTNRYTIMTAEASIIARKPIRKGDPIKYLSGIQVEMTEKEEKELCSRNDFSIVLSSRRKRPSLFLGPARFANHDCDSNAKLNTTGPHGIHIVARKDIAVGDEITVTYGLDYFGEDNCECLCATCEALARNGWDPRGPILADSSDDESDDDDDSVSQSLASASQPRKTPSESLKRKRADDESVPGTEGPMPKKRGRGRPRKYPRPEDATTSEHDVPDASIPTETVDIDRKSRKPLLEESPEQQSAPIPIVSKAQRDALLDPARGAKIKGEDTMQQFLMAMHGYVVGQGFAQKPTFEDEPPVEQRKPNKRSFALSDSELAVYADAGVTFPDGIDREPTPPADPSENITANPSPVEKSTARLPAIRKERSFSRLRNVVNADDERDPFSIPASPAPQPESLKRKRGRPRKTAVPERESTDPQSPSPSSTGNDSASYVSGTSSATSVDAFAAGNIAENICELYTTGVKRDAETTEKPVAEPTRRMGTRSHSRLHNDRVSPAKCESEREHSLRRSVRRGTSEAALTRPVRSIEKTETPTPATPVGAGDGTNADDDDADDDADIRRGPVRTPGDHTLCQIRLATPYHRWVECRNCDEYFVQGDAYLTRIACPRCERHSKLYGYHWPKTDREGKHDLDVRILDHRTIHRFIDPEEERSERKGRRTLAAVLREQEARSSIARHESLESDGYDRRLRDSPRRRSESRRKLRSTM